MPAFDGTLVATSGPFDLRWLSLEHPPASAEIRSERFMGM